MNRHAAAGYDETTSRSHHELLHQIGQLGHRERVLCSENDQLRAQLVEMKEQEKKKYDDLMVQYNMKREYEDDGLDNLGTSNNQVMVKTESIDYDVVKQEIKEEYEDNNDIFIKQEYVPSYIKTESIDEDVKEIIKQEIKEEYDEDDHNDCGHDLRLVKKELVSDDDANCEQLSDHSLLTEESNETNQVSVNDQQVDKGDHEPANDGQNELPTSKQSKTRKRKRTSKSITTESSLENSLTSDELSLGRNASSKRTRFFSFRKTAEQMSSVSSGVDLSGSHNQDGIDSSGVGEEDVGQNEEEEMCSDSETELGDEDEGAHHKIKMVKLKCTEDGCEDEVADRVELHDHLRVKHHISPHRCLAEGCNDRFEQWGELGPHVRDNHSNISTWPCPHCIKTFKSQHCLYQHLHFYHFEGQFKCGYDGCHYDRVAKLRSEIRTHQDSVHRKLTIYICQFHNCGKSFNHIGHFNRHQQIHSGTKSFHCDWIGCDKSYVQKSDLEVHQRIHQNVKPFKCTWNMCDYASTKCGNVIKHIRTQHFHLPASQKAQRQLGIEDNRNPHDYLLNTTQPI